MAKTASNQEPDKWTNSRRQSCHTTFKEFVYFEVQQWLTAKYGTR